MAIYPYKCVGCGHEQEVYQSIASYSVTPNRPICCGQPMERKITLVLAAVDRQQAYVSPLDGSVIDSREKERQHMSKHGVVHFDEIAPDFERNKKRRLAETKVSLKQDLIESVHKVEAGYRPQVETVDHIVPEAA